MDHQHSEHKGSGNASRSSATTRQLIAHFPNEREARHAEQMIAPRVSSSQIEPVSESQMQQELEQAREGISTVEIGLLAWVGLALGVIVGGIIGALAFTGRLALPGIGPALSAGPLAAVFLGAGILGSLGWLLGALAHLGMPVSKTESELHAVVPEGVISEIEQVLVKAGATDVVVRGDGGEHPH